MVCIHCGAPTLDDISYCPNCHHSVDPRHFGREVDPLTGVHGWLAFFVFVLKYFNPLLLAIGVLRWLSHGPVAADSILPNSPVVDFVSFLAVVFITGFGIYTADNLQKVCPGAVNKVKQYLLFCFLYLLTELLVVSGGALFHIIEPTKFRACLEGFISQVAWLEIWYLYFTRSKRVANTYIAAVAHS